ncbi:hypothetical protein BKP56_11465 [Marinilactibacillus sp. 15R]|uniref:O-antigen ligase family protein n=1 Tax=Marinilactibacillus TaxID=191769 RepID=UPI00090BC86F|nr:O-antigen ligase family protein [Marinilactibacillus sp. 15R]API89840.1 hypothetical protein BKP56_11465 [Marinilactibacillus sp. 15R]
MTTLRTEKWEYKLICLALFLAPFDTIRLPGIYLTVSDVVFISILPIFLINLLRHNSNINSMTVRLASACFLIIFGFVISLFRGSEHAVLPTITYAIQFLFVLLYLPLLINKYILKKDIYLKMLHYYILGLLSSIVIGLIIDLFFPGVNSTLVSKGIFVSSIRFGAFIGSNGLAKLISAMIPLVFLLYHRRIIDKKYVLFAVLVLLYALLKTSSNGGTLATVFSLSLVIILSRTWKLKKEIYSVIGVSVFLGSVLILNGYLDIQMFISRVYNNFRYLDISEAGSYNLKIEIMKEALGMIAKNPIIGIGAEQYVRLSSFNSTVHNSYLSFWSEGGIISLIGFLYIFIIIYKLLISRINAKMDKNTSLYILIFTSVLMLNFITDTQVYQRFRMIPIILVIYILYQNVYISKKRNTQEDRSIVNCINQNRDKILG